jgi:hypothetical protein
MLGILVFISVKTPGASSLVVLGGTYFLGIAFFVIIHYMNRAALRQKELLAEGEEDKLSS